MSVSDVSSGDDFHGDRVSSPARVSVCSLCLESCLDIKAVRKLLRDALDWNQLEQVDSGNCSLSVEGG